MIADELCGAKHRRAAFANTTVGQLTTRSSCSNPGTLKIELEGEPTIVVDGVEHPLREGSFARLAPEPKRTVRNDGDSLARILIVSAPVASGYEPMEWA